MNTKSAELSTQHPPKIAAGHGVIAVSEAVSTAPSANDTTCSESISPMMDSGATQAAPQAPRTADRTLTITEHRRQSFHVKHGSVPTAGPLCRNRGRAMAPTDTGTRIPSSRPLIGLVYSAGLKNARVSASQNHCPSRFAFWAPATPLRRSRHRISDRHCVAHPPSLELAHGHRRDVEIRLRPNPTQAPVRPHITRPSLGRRGRGSGPRNRG